MGWIHQDAWFYTLALNGRQAHRYHFNTPGNGLYVFVLQGRCEAAGEALEWRDGIGISDAEEVIIASEGSVEMLLIEVPMR